MGLRDVAANAARTIFNIVGDITVDCSITRNVGETYDEVTDTYSGGTATTYSFKGIVTHYTYGMYHDNAVQDGDYTVLVRKAEIGIRPLNGENIVVNGETLKIVAPVKEDTAGAIYSIHVRR